MNSGSSFLVFRPPLSFGSTEAKYLIFANAPELIAESALNCVPSLILWPLRKSRDPELAIVFAPSFTSFSLVVTFGIEDTICVCCFSFLTNASTSSWLALAFSNMLLAFIRSTFTADKVEAGALSLFTVASSSSNFVILVSRRLLSTTFFSTSTLVLSSFTLLGLFTEATFSFSALTVFIFSGILSPFPDVAFVSLVAELSLDAATSFALATPVPKKILAPITIDAAPNLNFLIE